MPLVGTRAVDGCLRFRLDQIDYQTLPLHKIKPARHERLLRKLASLENWTVKQARDNEVLAFYDIADIPNKSLRDILIKRFDGRDNIACLKVERSQAGRLLGFCDDNEFHILWWDPDHDVWPQGKNRR